MNVPRRRIIGWAGVFIPLVMANTNTAANDRVTLLAKMRQRFRLVWTPMESGGIFLVEQTSFVKRLLKLARGQQADLAAIEQMADVVRDFLQTGELAPGHYEVTNYHRGSDVGTIPLDAYGSPGIAVPSEKKIVVQFNSEHRTLLRHLNVREWDNELELMDPKRPYGNMNYFFIDMAAALGEQIPLKGGGKPEFSNAQIERYRGLHRQMLFAAQAFWEHARA